MRRLLSRPVPVLRSTAAQLQQPAVRLLSTAAQPQKLALPHVAALGWEARPIADALGCEIIGADLTNVGPEELKAIREALLEHEVIFFRDQRGFSPAHHSSLAHAFGPVQTHPAYATVGGYPEITILENDRDRPSLIEKWHTDMTFRPCPPLGSILHGLIVPPEGARTVKTERLVVWYRPDKRNDHSLAALPSTPVPTCRQRRYRISLHDSGL